MFYKNIYKGYIHQNTLKNSSMEVRVMQRHNRDKNEMINTVRADLLAPVLICPVSQGG